MASAASTTQKVGRGSSVRSPKKRAKRSSYNRWFVPTYADPTKGDRVDGDDLAIRRAAVEALGSYNGSVVVTDPETGRILTVVNQKMAFQSGFTPCSTIKLVTALAALNEGLVERSTLLRLGRRYTLDLTQALARSDNPYFMRLGNKLGFERVTQYARLFGLGEKAGLGIEGEEPGVLPLVPPEYGGVGIMTAFGLGISLTPLELSALLSALANGGTLYYLQYPKSQEEAADFVPKVKRELDLGTEISDVKVGMRAAVEAGTARRADDPTQPVLGKTGTCTDFRARAHLGWFGSFNDVGRNKLVVVVLLTGGRSVSGPVAAGVAGAFYRQLSEQQYFASTSGVTPADLIATQACCAR